MTDNDDNDEGRYYNGEVTFCISNGMAPIFPGNINPGSGGLLYYKASINPSAVPSVPVSNTANIFGLNFDLTNSTAFTNVAIQYGGEFSFISDNARGAVGKINFFSASFVNKGNDQRSFSFAIAAATNSDGAVWTNWDMKIVETDSTNELSSWTLDPEERADFRIMITASIDLTNKSWLQFKLIASNDSAVASGATNYTGQDGIHYGGDMGEDWTGAMNSTNYGKVCQQSNEWIKLVVRDVVALVDKVKISPISDPVSGSTVKYEIRIGNGGVKNVKGLKITDTIPAGTTYLFNSLNQLGIGLLSDIPDDGDNGSYNMAGNEIVFCVDNGNAPNFGGTLLTNFATYITYEVTINTGVYGYITNTLVVSGSNFESFTTNCVIFIPTPAAGYTADIIMYVDTNCLNPTPPYTNIAIAALTPQIAIDYIATLNGGTKDLVTNNNSVLIYIADGTYPAYNIAGFTTSADDDIKLVRYSGTPVLEGPWQVSDKYVTIDGLTCR